MHSLNLTQKIAIPLIVMVFLICLMAISSMITLFIDGHAITEINSSIEKQKTLAAAELHYTKMLMAENGYALSGNSHYKQTIASEKWAVQDSINQLEALELTYTEQAEIDTFQAELDRLNHELDILLGGYESNENTLQETVEQLDSTVALVLADDIEALSETIEDGVQQAMLALEAADRREFWFTILPVLVVIPMAIMVVFITINRISRPLLQLVQMAEKITMRDFSTRVTAGSLDEIGMLTKAFNAMAEEIERRYDELESFAYIVAHDLKNPISGISGLSECMLDPGADRITAEQKEMLESIHYAAHSMSSLITDLLEFARAGKIEFSKEPLSMNAILEDITQELKFYIKERGAKIDIQKNLPKLYCDPVRFSQVWKNLIYNAIKYNDKAEPTVTISAQNTDDGYYLFQIEDNGIGIDEKDYLSIFLPFKRATTDQKFEGTGIGLAIVKRVVDFHGGRIWVNSQKSLGSTFHFTMPRVHSLSTTQNDEKAAA